MNGRSMPEVLKLAEAEMDRQQYEQVVSLLAPFTNPGTPRLLRVHAQALCRLGRPLEGVDALMKALALKIDDADTHLQLGFALETLQMPGEAAECFRTVVALRPDDLIGLAYLAHGERRGVRWENAEANNADLLRALRAKPDDTEDEFGVPFALVGQPHHPSDMLKAARLSTRYLTRRAVAMPPRQARARKKLRIGYLSADFHSHATVALMVEVLESRDRERFEVLLFSHGRKDDSPMRRRVEQACDRFIEVGELDLAGIARRVRAEEVDILVDLKGHTADSRSAALAFRPAPVQVAWLGFPGTCGADFIDYIIGDAIVTPLEDAPYYTEHIAQMPACYQPNDNSRERLAPPSRAELGLPDDALVLLSANQVYKLSPALFDIWMEILRRVPQAVLWQLTGGEQADARLREQARLRGVDPARLIFAPQCDMPAHWRRIAAADFALDTWPCDGHTTTSDCLSAGVPVVTLRDQGFASRVAASILATAGLAELVCESADQYVELACAMATDPARLAALRAQLQTRPPALFDSQRFARELEALYQRMWERAVAGLPPAALPAQIIS